MGCCFWIVKLIVSLAFIDSWYFFATNITKRQHTPNNYQKKNNTTYIFIFYHPVFAPRQVAILTLDIGYTFIAGRTAASAVASRRIRTCAKRRAIYIRNTLAGRASAKSIEWHDMRCVILFIMQPLHRKLLRALPYWACGRVAAALPVNAAQSPYRISSRYSLCDGTGRVAAALPVSAALIDSPCSQSRRLQRRFFTLCNYVIFSAPRRPKLHLRRFRTSQM
jgi:hypothetical protein